MEKGVSFGKMGESMKVLGLQESSLVWVGIATTKVRKRKGFGWMENAQNGQSEINKK